MPAWIAWMVAVVVLLSVARELGTGRARVRGLGVYHRAQQRGRYWLAIALKVALAALIAGLAAQGLWR